MKKTIVLVGCAALMGTATACKDQQGQSVAPNQPLSANRPQNPADRSPTGMSPTQNAKELAGTLKSVDKDKRSLTIASSTGGQQEVKLADSATITRDGSKIDVDQLQPGDEVRASFDSATKQASTITVQSNQTNKAK